ncbi:hypothetical protein Tco_1014581, partial [Tanacetum coccineum]
MFSPGDVFWERILSFLSSSLVTAFRVCGHTISFISQPIKYSSVSSSFSSRTVPWRLRPITSYPEKDASMLGTSGHASGASAFPAASFLGELFQLLVVATDDNAYHSTSRGLRRMQAHLGFSRSAHSLFPSVSHGERGWGEIELRWSTHGEYFMKLSCVLGPTDGAK